jgi:hypothetical protein
MEMGHIELGKKKRERENKEREMRAKRERKNKKAGRSPAMTHPTSILRTILEERSFIRFLSTMETCIQQWN